MTCLSCGFQFSGDLTFCPKCGMPAPEKTAEAMPPAPFLPEQPERQTAELSWHLEEQPEAIDTVRPVDAPAASGPLPQAAPVAFSPPPEHHITFDGTVGAAAHGLSHAANAAKARWDEAGGMSGMTGGAKKFAVKSGADAKNFFSYLKSKPFVNPKNILTAIIVALALIVMLIIFGMGSRNLAAAILLSGFTAALVVLVYKRVHMPSGTAVHPAKMQMLHAGGYAYLLNARGDIYRIKDGVDMSTRLDVSGVTCMFSDHDRIFACKRDGSLVTALHGSNGASEILPAGTVLQGIAGVSGDGYVYFSSAKVYGSPVCRIKSGGGAVHIVTE